MIVLFLKTDVRSYNGTLYGKKDTEITIFVDHGNFKIVCDPTGNRFAVKAELIGEKEVKEDPKNELLIESVAALPNQSIPVNYPVPPDPKPKKDKPPKPGQQALF